MAGYGLFAGEDHLSTNDFDVLGVIRPILTGIDRTLGVMRDCRCRLVERPRAVVGVVGIQRRRFESCGRLALFGYRSHCRDMHRGSSGTFDLNAEPTGGIVDHQATT